MVCEGQKKCKTAKRMLFAQQVVVRRLTVGPSGHYVIESRVNPPRESNPESSDALLLRCFAFWEGRGSQNCYTQRFFWFFVTNERWWSHDLASSSGGSSRDKRKNQSFVRLPYIESLMSYLCCFCLDGSAGSLLCFLRRERRREWLISWRVQIFLFLLCSYTHICTYLYLITKINR